MPRLDIFKLPSHNIELHVDISVYLSHSLLCLIVVRHCHMSSISKFIQRPLTADPVGSFRLLVTSLL